MKQICDFCEERDIERVVPSLSVDLYSAVTSGVVLDTGVIEEYNNIETPDSVHTRVKDVFQALDLQKAYLSKGKLSGTSLSGSTEHTTTTVTASSGPATAGE